MHTLPASKVPHRVAYSFDPYLGRRVRRQTRPLPTDRVALLRTCLAQLVNLDVRLRAQALVQFDGSSVATVNRLRRLSRELAMLADRIVARLEALAGPRETMRWSSSNAAAANRAAHAAPLGSGPARAAARRALTADLERDYARACSTFRQAFDHLVVLDDAASVEIVLDGTGLLARHRAELANLA